MVLNFDLNASKNKSFTFSRGKTGHKTKLTIEDVNCLYAFNISDIPGFTKCFVIQSSEFVLIKYVQVGVLKVAQKVFWCYLKKQIMSDLCQIPIIVQKCNF